MPQNKRMHYIVGTIVVAVVLVYIDFGGHCG